MTESYKTQVIRAHVVSELLDYIEDKHDSGTTLAMAKLTSLYDKRLVALGFSHVKCNRTRLKENIERMIPDINPVVRKNPYLHLVIYDDLDINPVIRKNRFLHIVIYDDLSKAVADMTDNTSKEISTLHKAALILRKEYLNISHAHAFT